MKCSFPTDQQKFSPSKISRYTVWYYIRQEITVRVWNALYWTAWIEAFSYCICLMYVWVTYISDFYGPHQKRQRGPELLLNYNIGMKWHCSQLLSAWNKRRFFANNMANCLVKHADVSTRCSSHPQGKSEARCEKLVLLKAWLLRSHAHAAQCRGWSAGAISTSAVAPAPSFFMFTIQQLGSS